MSYPGEQPVLKDDFDPNLSRSSQGHTATENAQSTAIMEIAAALGDDPVNPSVATPGSTASTLENLLGQIKQVLQDIKGEASWYAEEQASLSELVEDVEGLTTDLSSAVARFPVQESDIGDGQVSRGKLKNGALPEVHIRLGGTESGWSPGTTFANLDQSRTKIDFSNLLDGATAAFLRVNSNNGGGGRTAEYQLYNVTDAAVITGSSVTSTVTSARQATSADILGNLPSSEVEVMVQGKVTTGAIAIWNIEIVIQY